jgi:nitrogen fixation NifU-like protein
MYNAKTIRYFTKPRNYGKIKNPSGVGKVGNVVCGDVMWLYLAIAKDKKGREIITNATFESFGCVAAIATSSITTKLVKGKTVNEALSLSHKEIIDALGGLPLIKTHCSLLAVDGLTEAIFDYLTKTKAEIPPELMEKHTLIKKKTAMVDKRHGAE